MSTNLTGTYSKQFEVIECITFLDHFVKIWKYITQVKFSEVIRAMYQSYQHRRSADSSWELEYYFLLPFDRLAIKVQPQFSDLSLTKTADIDTKMTFQNLTYPNSHLRIAIVSLFLLSRYYLWIALSLAKREPLILVFLSHLALSRRFRSVLYLSCFLDCVIRDPLEQRRHVPPFPLVVVMVGE